MNAVGNSVKKSVVEAKVGVADHVRTSIVGGHTEYGYAVIRAAALMHIEGLAQAIRLR